MHSRSRSVAGSQCSPVGKPNALNNTSSFTFETVPVPTSISDALWSSLTPFLSTIGIQANLIRPRQSNQATSIFEPLPPSLSHTQHFAKSVIHSYYYHTHNMDLYRATLAGSLLLNSLVLAQTYRSRQTESVDSMSSEKIEHRGREGSDRDSLHRLKWRFFPIYLLVNAADWLQGPYIYPIYKGTVSSIRHHRKLLTICR